jgi:hypothetical protein
MASVALSFAGALLFQIDGAIQATRLSQAISVRVQNQQALGSAAPAVTAPSVWAAATITVVDRAVGPAIAGVW